MKVIIVSNNEKFINKIKNNYKDVEVQIVNNMKEASKSIFKDL